MGLECATFDAYHVPYVGFATYRNATVKIRLYFKRLMFMQMFCIKKIKKKKKKVVTLNTACLDNSENSCLNNCMKHTSKDTGAQAHGKFVPTCHNCGKVGHIRPNCFLSLHIGDI